MRRLFPLFPGGGGVSRDGKCGVRMETVLSLAVRHWFPTVLAAVGRLGGSVPGERWAALDELEREAKAMCSSGDKGEWELGARVLDAVLQERVYMIHGADAFWRKAHP